MYHSHLTLTLFTAVASRKATQNAQNIKNLQTNGLRLQKTTSDSAYKESKYTVGTVTIQEVEQIL